MNWQNPKTGLETEMPLRGDGDVRIFQRRIGAPAEQFTGRIISHYDYRERFLIHTILFFLQTGQPVPFRNNWEEKLYKGKFPEPSSIGAEHAMFSICKRADGGPTKSNLIRLTENPSSLPVAHKIGDGGGRIKVYPTIDHNNNHLIYINDFGPRVVLLDSQDVFNVHTTLLQQMLTNTRGQGLFPKIIYSKFPFEVYEKI